MDATGFFGFGDALDAVNAGFIFHAFVDFRTISVAYFKNDFFETTQAGFIGMKEGCCPSDVLGVARVHAEEASGKERRLVSARARADFHDDVAGVSRVFWKEESLESGFFKGFLGGQARIVFEGERLHIRIGFGVYQGSIFSHSAFCFFERFRCGEDLEEFRPPLPEVGELFGMRNNTRIGQCPFECFKFFANGGDEVLHNSSVQYTGRRRAGKQKTMPEKAGSSFLEDGSAISWAWRRLRFSRLSAWTSQRA